MSKRRHQYAKSRRVSDIALAFDPTWIVRLSEESERMYFGETSSEATPLAKAIRYAWRTELSEVQRRYFLLYYGDHLTQREVAERYGVTESTVCRTLARARRTLRHYLQFYYRVPKQ